VPFLEYNGNNAAFFAKTLEAALHGTDGANEWDAARIAAISGEGNRLVWLDGKWGGGCEVIEALNETPFEVEKRVFDAMGWQVKCTAIEHDSNGNFSSADPAQVQQEIVASIDKGIPVIVYRRPDQVYNLFFGYEDNGKKMISWDVHSGDMGGKQNKTLAVLEDWQRGLTACIILQEKTAPKPEKEAALEMFARIVAHARQADEVRGWSGKGGFQKVGLAAWESFLNLLENDDFSALALNDVGRRFGIYCDTLCQIWARNCALPYYKSLAERYPEWREPLEKAVAALDECAGYGGFIWKHGFGFNDAGYEKFKSPEGRKLLADAGREAMRKDMEAVEQFEKILKMSTFD
jgi:hypothetical protein